MKLRSHKRVALSVALVLIALISSAPLWAAPPTQSQGERVQDRVEEVGFAFRWVASLWDALRVVWGSGEAGAKIDIDGLTVAPSEEGTHTQASGSESPEPLGNTTEEGPKIDIDG